MSMNIRFPNITAVTPAEQINQIKSYLHQLVEQLNWALSTIESGSASESTEEPAFSGITEDTVNEMKSLIAQSTAMLNTYYEKINIKLEGQYVSQKDFDAHKQEVAESMAGLDGKYVSQESFDGHTQEVSQKFDDLANQYVSKTDFDTYVQENTQTITDLQQDIIELSQRIDAMQETGGEENG